MTKLKPFKCVICHKEITGEFGNNPYPIASLDDGKCCRKCDYEFVLPARIQANKDGTDTKLLSVKAPPTHFGWGADKIPSHKFGPGYDNIHTQRATRRDDSVKEMLLRTTVKTEKINPKIEDDDRPLIDKVHEATFYNPVGLQWVEDKYKLRMLLRKAHRFTIDDDTSRMVADFSVAISKDLETTRRLAIPPYPVTWFEINNRLRLERIRSLGIPLTPTAAGETAAGSPVEKVGWLIHEDASRPNAYYAMYFCQTDEGVVCAPLPYWWHVLGPNPGNVSVEESDMAIKMMHNMTFGVAHVNVHPYDACLGKLGIDVDQYVVDLMIEIAGELRHIWGMLIALGAGQLGAKASFTDQRLHDRRPRMPNGKPLLPLEHKLLHIHLGKHVPSKIVARAYTQHRMREHDVRAHWRTLKNSDGTVKKRVPIASHKRGDITLGRVEKNYKVEK